MSFSGNQDFSLDELKKAKPADLPILAGQLREKIYRTCCRSGGHLAGSLGAVELIIALHYVFSSPTDQIIFDVGHQSLAHKLLTGREARFSHLRQQGGLSGFTDPTESPYDHNYAGHAGNSVSLAMGLSIADPKHVKIAVVGDGSFSNGMTLEALNHLGTTEQNVLIILNDNGMSIDETVGALASQRSYQELIEAMGLAYIGPHSGHDLLGLINALRQLKDFRRPRVLHLRTVKGKDIACSESAPCLTHFYQEGKAGGTKLQDLVGKQLVKLGEQNDKLTVITPAMKQGGGLVEFSQRFPRRFFDVGICEEHSVGLAVGQALGGLKPVLHLYASFAQRGLDQLLGDMALNKAPLTLLIDRAGLAGEDGPTHQGVYIFGLLKQIPHLKILAPGDWLGLEQCLGQIGTGDQPVAIMYPKACLSKAEVEAGKVEPLDGWIRRSHEATKVRVSVGWLKNEVRAVNDPLVAHYHLTTLKPLPKSVGTDLLAANLPLEVWEENTGIGGVARDLRWALPELEVTSKCVDDEFVAIGSRKQQLARYHLMEQQV